MFNLTEMFIISENGEKLTTGLQMAEVNGALFTSGIF
jgi:hypothetical protein